MLAQAQLSVYVTWRSGRALLPAAGAGLLCIIYGRLKVRVSMCMTSLSSAHLEAIQGRHRLYRWCWPPPQARPALCANSAPQR